MNACQNLSLEYKALASRPLSSKDPTINERQYRIAKEIMDIANYLSKSASLIESCEHKQSAWKPGKVNLIKYTNLNLVSQLTKQSRYSYGSVRYTKSFKEWNKKRKNVLTNKIKFGILLMHKGKERKMIFEN